MSAKDRQPDGGTATRLNPRRVAPEISVSLRRQPGKRTGSIASDQPSVGDVSAASNVAALGEGPTPPPNKGSAEPYTADKWFDESNQNAAGKTNVKFIDDDPPFYLKKQRSSDDDGDESRGRFSSSKSNHTRPVNLSYPIGPSQLYTNSSTSEDFRSVIDDLTVENQELKRKLRKYEGVHTEHLQDEKLFEVRVYQMSQSRRRKLESLLRDFVSTIGNSPPESLSSANLPYLPTLGPPPARAINIKGSASSTSNRPVDSAYASMSTSNTASISQTQNGEARRPIRPATANPKDQQVQSYLQTISRGLLPKYPPYMTEKAKKRLVVRRLEQLFVGRGDTSSKLSQSQQQQEVSQSAANADRRETEAMGHRVQAEGRREAKMLQPNPADTLDVPVELTNNGANSSAVTPDQRPTRPLDLDPSRAQNPAETISYMKHLGFSSPKMDTDKAVRDSEGWVFLNLLINMAQLHTLNVTPDFVRNALAELSSKFELSEDGQNVRWKGGHRGSKLSSDSSANSEESNDSPPDDGGEPRRNSHSKGAKSGANTLKVPPGSARPRPGGTLKNLRHWPNSQNRAEHQYYSPLFYYPDDNASGSPLGEISSNSMSQDKSGELSGESTSLENTKPSSNTTVGETGSLIYYRKARFCTDLKGDPSFPPSNLIYEKKGNAALGSTPQQLGYRTPEAKGALSSPDKMAFEPDQDNDSGYEDIDVPGMESFPSTLSVRSGSRPAKHFSVSGIGGITPADNFCIDTRRKYGGAGGESELVGSQVRELAPEPLPPPSYAFLHFSSSSSDLGDSDSDDEADAPPYANSVAPFASELNERHFVPPGFLAEFESSSAGRDNTPANANSGAKSRETSDESSFDMLEYARKADPETVAAQEAEFDESQAALQDGVPPPGSVAATVGDRSTFLTSQEDNASVDERHLRLIQERKTSSLKHERTDTDVSTRDAKYAKLDGQ